MLPLFKFTSATKICSSTLFLSTTSYFTNIAFRQVAANTADNYIFKFGVTGTLYDFEIVDMTQVPLTNINCYTCTLAVFEIHAKTFTIASTTHQQLSYLAYNNNYKS